MWAQNYICRNGGSSSNRVSFCLWGFLEGNSVTVVFRLSFGTIRNTVIFRHFQITMTWCIVATLNGKLSLDLRGVLLHCSCCDESQGPSPERKCWFRVDLSVVQVLLGFSVCIPISPQSIWFSVANSSIISSCVIKSVRQKWLLPVTETRQVLFFQPSPHKFSHETVTMLVVGLAGRHQIFAKTKAKT